MSNRYNFTLADAFFRADEAAHKYDMYNQKKSLLREYENIYDELYDKQTQAADEASIYNLAGKLIGATVGAFTGGPKAAAAGYSLGGGAGDFLYGVQEDLGINKVYNDIEALQKDIESFDWTVKGKYLTLEDKDWMDKVKDASDSDADDAKMFLDSFYDPFYQDLLEDIVAPVLTQAMSNDKFSKKLSDVGSNVQERISSLLPKYRTQEESGVRIRIN